MGHDTRAPKRNIYVATSWRNSMQPMIIALLRSVPSFTVYDFREPEPGVPGFSWTEIDPYHERWDSFEYITALEAPPAVEGYKRDIEAMEAADTFVLVLPCGKSAHLELGWAAGKGKETVILFTDPTHVDPELMYKMVDHLVTSVFDLLGVLGVED